MKQKIMIRVPTSGQKSCAKVMKIAVSLPGVESATLQGDDKGQIEITGDVDPVKLTTKLRRKMRCVELVSVTEIKKEEKKEKPPAEDPIYVPVYPSGPYGSGYVYLEPTTQGYQDPYPYCSIM